MNKMPWLDSLNEQQMQIANMIVDKAEKEGVDPKLALSIAFQESKLSHGSFQKDKGRQTCLQANHRDFR
jgi:hypothetical protein